MTGEYFFTFPLLLARLKRLLGPGEPTEEEEETADRVGRGVAGAEDKD
jgi:hypothetical protein